MTGMPDSKCRDKEAVLSMSLVVISLLAAAEIIAAKVGDCNCGVAQG